jgi:hypothetical protein
MKKLRMFALPVMLASCAFLFAEQNIAEANYCLVYGDYCVQDASCCVKVCCKQNDPREICEYQTPNSCL